MAVLVDLTNGEHIYLHAHHSFGRLSYAVDTLISGSFISKHHAIIEYFEQHWYIRDLSSNGTWVNQSQLPQNNRTSLHCNDKIAFAEVDNPRFQLVDLSPPHDALVPYQNIENFVEQIIHLQPYHLLPNDKQPELAVFYDAKAQHWCVEKLNQSDGHSLLNENDTLNIAGKYWQLKLSHFEAQTDKLDNQLEDFTKLNFIFELSQDEEVTELRLQTPNDVVDFYARSHHYLTLNLARYRIADAQKGLEQQQQGWVHPEILARDLGLDLSHLNIQIHRARKQFADALDHKFNAQQMIERHAGKLRFGGSEFKIYKGHQLESQWPNQATTEH